MTNSAEMSLSYINRKEMTENVGDPLDWAIEKYKDDVVKGKGAPMALLGNETDIMIMKVEQFFSSAEAKDALVDALKTIAKAEEAYEFMLLSEAWTVMTTKEKYDPNIPPSENPDKQEALYIVRETKTVSKIITYPIHRKNTKIVLGGPEETCVLQGRFFGIVFEGANNDVEHSRLN